MVPKVTFETLGIKENLEELVYYAKIENSQNSPLNFYQFTLNLFPELKGKLKPNMSNKEIYMILDNEVKPTLQKLQEKTDEIKKYQAIWNKVNNQIMKELEKQLNIKWPENETIICRVGLLPVCPRDIMGRTFNVNYGMNPENIISTTIHELCHFIYFEKWKQIYPNYSEEEFDRPHIAWYLSEAMIDPLINNEIFKKYTNDGLSSYTVFYETEIEGKSIIDTLRDYVNQNSIEKAIQMGYEFFKKHENEIRK